MLATCDRCGVESEELVTLYLRGQAERQRKLCPACRLPSEAEGKRRGMVSDGMNNRFGEYCLSCGERHTGGPCPDIPPIEDEGPYSYA